MCRVFALSAAALVLAACGLDAVGELVVTPDAAAAVDGGVDAADAARDVAVEAAPQVDAGSPVVYAVSGRFWVLRLPNTWSSFDLPNTSCPALDEVAVDGEGAIYAANAQQLHRVDATNRTCSRVGTASGPYPPAMAFVPRGTIDPARDALVGYSSSGDYVRIDVSTGTVATVKTNALGGATAGDLVAVGVKLFAVMRGGPCPDDCLWEVSPTTGERVGGAAGTLPGGRTVTGLAQWGGTLLAFTDQDAIYELDPASPGNARTRSQPPNFTNVTYRGAASHPYAPPR